MLVQTPPMGWNSWNTFGENINEQVVRDTADAIVNLGLRDAGYEYVVIDDCWSMRKRDENGRLVANPEKFPSGMKALADYVHSKGLKFGIYSCVGFLTCAEYPGSFDHEFIDAETFAEWGVDYLKYDFCYKPGRADGALLYHRMGLALRQTGREILFSACNWGREDVEKWIRSAGAHIYRSTGDIGDNFQSYKEIAVSQFNNLAYSTPGCFNDIDMLICGMHGNGNVALGGCTEAEYRTHFAMWCLFNSPLMIGCDLSKIDDECLALLKNKELLSINQDIEARPPMKLTRDGDDRTVFFRHLSNGEYILAFFNLTDCDRTMYQGLFDVGLPYDGGYGFTGYEIFTGEKLEGERERVIVDVPMHDCRLFRLKLTKI
ncbi:MAG: glycoside hydrolase family 27 protein [Ruminococcaceae bacterium]|nr:glycoside hydrolase family 27 protein [Oscillospiraceae bacterium]